MTVVEFFDKSPIQNIASALLLRPERVVFVCDDEDEARAATALYRRVLSCRKIDTRLDIRRVNRQNLEAVIDVLCEIAKEDEDCIFDITGGDELYLVALGTIFERTGRRHILHRFNLEGGNLCEYRHDGSVCSKASVSISAEENIILHAGELVSCGASITADEDDEFINDVALMWNICRSEPSLWNSLTGVLAAISDSAERQNITIPAKKAQDALKRWGIKSPDFISKMNSLCKAGLIRQFIFGDELSFTYKSDRIKKCLTVAGQILELTVATRLAFLRNEKGERIYSDIRVGAVIDWSGRGEGRVINEIDVLAMKDSVPVFISCKNGSFAQEELYKLRAVSSHFGSRMAKRALVTTELDKLGTKADFIRARAEDMDVTIIERADEMSDTEFNEALKNLGKSRR